MAVAHPRGQVKSKHLEISPNHLQPSRSILNWLLFSLHFTYCLLSFSAEAPCRTRWVLLHREVKQSTFIMPRQTSKRSADAAGLTVIDLEEGPDRVSKTSRNGSPSNLPNSNTDQQFDPSADYIPLTQIAGADEEDAAAAEAVQDSDEPVDTSFILYGSSKSPYAPLLQICGVDTQVFE